MRELKACESETVKDSGRLWTKCIWMAKPSWQLDIIFTCPLCGRKFKAVAGWKLGEMRKAWEIQQ